MLALSALALVACAPTPLTDEEAKARCAREVGMADGVRGNIKVGAGTGGAHAGVGIVLTDRVFNPQTPEEFMADCIAEKTGRAPIKTRVGIRIGAST